MQKDINLIIEDFKQSIFDSANQSNLPISVVYYVLKDVMNEVESEYTNYINQARTRERAEARKAEEAAMAASMQSQDDVPAPEDMTEIIEDN